MIHVGALSNCIQFHICCQQSVSPRLCILIFMTVLHIYTNTYIILNQIYEFYTFTLLLIQCCILFLEIISSTHISITFIVIWTYIRGCSMSCLEKEESHSLWWTINSMKRNELKWWVAVILIKVTLYQFILNIMCVDSRSIHISSFKVVSSSKKNNRKKWENL